MRDLFMEDKWRKAYIKYFRETDYVYIWKKNVLVSANEQRWACKGSEEKVRWKMKLDDQNNVETVLSCF